VPEASLEFAGDSTYVYVLTDTTSSKQTFERCAVTTGISDGLNIEIKKGLQVGSKVRGIEKMKE
jgi:HlyD family secretion protein